MVKDNKPRAGSLQFWPRKRITKYLPNVNWDALKTNSIVKGYIGYKVGMTSCLVKDNTPNSRTKDKRIIIPGTVLELPPVKIFSVRFYKNGIVKDEILVENAEKELKKIVKLPKQKPRALDEIKDYDDIRLLVYTKAKDAGFKKTPDMTEIGLSGNVEQKLSFAKDKIGKDILASEILKDVKMLDVRGLTRGKGTVGTIKRFGIKLKQHKTEKGRRKPGNLGPWHPAHTTFRTPISGQLGLFTRVQYNSKVIKLGRIQETNINPIQGWPNYGNIHGEFIVVAGSVQGPVKRQILLTSPLRPTKFQTKKVYDLIKIGI